MKVKINLYPDSRHKIPVMVYDKLVYPKITIEGKAIATKVVNAGFKVGDKEMKIKMYLILGIGWVPKDSVEELE